MSTPVESLFTATMRSQEATTSALRTWADGLQAFTGAQSTLSEAPALITRYFDAVQQVLDIQRQFAETMIGVGAVRPERHEPGRRGGRGHGRRR